MEEFDPTLVTKAHAQLMQAMSKEGFAPTAGIGAAPPQGGMPMDPAMGGAPPMDPAMGGGMPAGAPPMDPAMAGGAMPPGAPPMAPAAGGAPPPPAGGEQMPPLMVSAEDLMTLFAQISQEMGGGAGGAPAEGSADTMKALDEITQRLDSIEGMLGGGGGPAVPPPGEMGAMMPPAAAEMPPMATMGEAMAPMMDATAAPMPEMPVAAMGDDGQVKIGRATKIGDLVANLRRK